MTVQVTEVIDRWLPIASIPTRNLALGTDHGISAKYLARAVVEYFSTGQT